MLFGFALIFIGGLIFSKISTKLKLPSLIGMIIVGIIMGPYLFDIIDHNLLLIAPELKEVALIIILMRAGLSIDLDKLKSLGRPALLMCFVPALFEIIGTILIAPYLFNISIIEAAVLGTVIAAVSPAVIVPRMIKLMDKGYGKNHGIPQLIMAGSSVDDVFVIVLFTSFTTLAMGGPIEMSSFIAIPISIILGALFGWISGMLVVKLFDKVDVPGVAKVVVLMSVAFAVLHIEDVVSEYVQFSGLLTIMCIGITLKAKRPFLAKKTSMKYASMWVPAEILLFVLIGTALNIDKMFEASLIIIILVCLLLIFRVAGVYLSLLKTPITKKERLFCMFAYLPKATVQAAIGSIPLSMGLESGELILTVAVVSILITAPLGAILIDNTYDKLLEQD